MKQKNDRPLISIGTVSLVLIFTMLCLVTFSVLSLSSAEADMRLSRKSADRVSAYYDAENRMSDVLFRISGCMEQSTDSPEAASWYLGLRSSLEGVDNLTFTDDSHLCCSVPLETDQLLYVVLELVYDGPGRPGHYEILTWEVRSTYDWDSDQPLPVL